MARIEIICPNCRQANRRGTDFVGRLLDPRLPQLCTLCGTNLRTGKRSADEFALGVLGWTATYSMHALVGAGGFMLMFGAIFLASTEFFESHPDWGRVLGIISMIAGAVVGLVLAERARRKGELHIHKKGVKRFKR